jgi:hypothetical protein
VNSLREAIQLARSDKGTQSLREAVSRLRTTSFFFFAFFVLAAGTSIGLWVWAGARPMRWQVISHSMFVGMAAFGTWNLSKLRRQVLVEARRASASCTRCGYPLPDIPSNSSCPECGLDRGA